METPGIYQFAIYVFLYLHLAALVYSFQLKVFIHLQNVRLISPI